ncbi:hypothetical protein EWE75_10220 [Sphingomonas populi]|uniref:DUF2306 domain-containing protein n=1 Tax=Sphingomonas populi TaxID=2484750 RepID=A0A4Q6Y528_9SPHN|nr:hypothetical protein [Sphingomonas populi]RZF64539.1 hypothetical protein EWE75_10220 [Sphingomonas populi]
MATVAQRGGAKLNTERRFFATMALVISAATFIGFAPSYYLAPMFAARPLSMLLHVHGVVFTAWILLYVAQTGLISASRADIHRIVGPVAVVLAIAMVPLGIAAAIVTKQVAAAHHMPPQGPPLVFPLGAILTFAVLVGAGFVRRKQSAWHKRLMLLGTAAILTTPLARITRFTHIGLAPAFGGMILTDVLLAALAIYDIRTRGKLHPATIWGGGFFLATQALRVALNAMPAWQAFAKGLTG